MAKNIRTLNIEDEQQGERIRTSEQEHPDPSPQDVARRAYDLYRERGAEDGHDIDDWLRAEQELRGNS